ncbi:MAG: hypothetical protein LBR79_05235 [Oscillospiraceae bacterium]|jgi:hypothetical protein|nr:hypothetical protein [Oscillospiraceae bacterium]
MVTVNIFKRCVLVLAFVLFTTGVAVGAVREETVEARRAVEAAERKVISGVEKLMVDLRNITFPDERLQEYIEELTSTIENEISVWHLHILLGKTNQRLHFVPGDDVNATIAQIGDVERDIVNRQNAILRKEIEEETEMRSEMQEAATAKAIHYGPAAHGVAFRGVHIKLAAAKSADDTTIKEQLNNLLKSLEEVNFCLSIEDWEGTETRCYLKYEGLVYELINMIYTAVNFERLYLILYEAEDILKDLSHVVPQKPVVATAIEQINNFRQDPNQQFSAFAACYGTIHKR